MKNNHAVIVCKHVAYVLLLLLLYIVQTVPGLFVLYGVKPIWVIPAAVAIAMREGEFTGGVYGALAGLLCDMGGFSLFGFNGLIVSACCVGAGLLVVHLMHGNLRSYLFFVFVTLMIRGSLEYLFAFGMWGYDDVGRIYAGQTLPVICWSTVAAVPVYWMVGGIFRKFETLLER